MTGWGVGCMQWLGGALIRCVMRLLNEHLASIGRKRCTDYDLWPDLQRWLSDELIREPHDREIMDAPFKDKIKLDNFLSDAQRECVERFGCWLRDKHFSREPVQRHVRAAKRVLCWANYAGIGIEDLNSKGIARYADALEARGKLRYRNGQYTAAFKGARRFAAFLSEAGMILSESAVAVERPALLEEFNNWMRSHRGITERTLDRYRPVIECLLRALGEEVECYDSKKLRDFVLNLAKRYSTTSTKHVTSPVRMFLRFLIATKRCRVGLEACIPTVPATVVCRATCPSMPLSESSQLVLKQRRQAHEIAPSSSYLHGWDFAQARWQGSSLATSTGSRER